MKQSKHEQVQATAFTLIELMVVVAIIAILASLVLPALSTAKQRAWMVSCNSNLHQIGLGMRMFADENSEYYPESGGGDLAWGSTDPTTGKAGWMQQIFPFTQTTNVYHCPGNVQLPPDQQGPFNYFNGCNAAYVENGTYAAVNMTEIHFPSAYVLSGDTAGILSPDEQNNQTELAAPFGSLDADKNDYLQNCVGGATNGTPYELWQIHNRGQNILFADGHSRWYKGFDVTEMTFGYATMSHWVDYESSSTATSTQ
jgi:prepilin-type N-terminal cleavage/methylation domain-containing protein/prepilin-type processing-associated H-X9-DG protein